MDAVKNFARVQVSTTYDDTDTEIVLTGGHGAKLPDPSSDGEFNLVWWDSTNYPIPSDDPNVEIVRCTARATDTLTVTRNQEGSGASTKSTGGAVYKMILGPTAKTMTDLNDIFDKYRDYINLGQSIDGFTVTEDGTGTVIAQGLELEIKTGTTSGEDSYIRATDSEFYWVQTGKVMSVEWTSAFWTDIATFTAWLVMSNGTAVPHVATSRHFGFTLNDASIYATNGDLTTQTTTDTGVDIAHANHTTHHHWRVDLTPGTDAKYYVNGVLKATHTTNLPPISQKYYLTMGLTAGDNASHATTLNRVLIEREY